MVSSLFAVSILIAQLATRPGSVPAPSPDPPPQAPYVLLVPQLDLPAERRTQVGLIYTPAVLASLAARTIAPVTLVSNAIKQQTPIVVLWQFAESAEPLPSGFAWLPTPQVAVVEPGSNELARMSPRPLWSLSDASFLRVLDPQREFHPVALVAAFRAEDLRPGLLVYHWNSSNVESGPPPHGWSRSIAGEVPMWR